MGMLVLLPLGMRMRMRMRLPLAMGLLWSLQLGTVWGASLGGAAGNASSTFGASVSPILQQTTAEPVVEEEEQVNTTEVASTTETGAELSCGSLLPPRRGSYYVEVGTGSSLGSVLVFWCREGYQLVGRERLSCVLHNGNARWSHTRPTCEGLPVPDGHGLRMAIVVAAVSGVVIIFLTVAFVVCCMRDQQQVKKKKKSQHSSRSRGRPRRRAMPRRSAAWQEREPGDWEVFPPPKIYNLSQQLEPPHANAGSPVYGPARGYENRGYLRSQDSLVRSPPGAMYRSDAQLYSHLMLQRAVPDSPAYLNISAPPTLKNPQRPRP
ncbi:sushi domain-containing protein 3 [Engraulis encrasicolus]|uniref:sushi domain-containing protein 3 n=1 Tax=Engraulis encrasicolus TaxID=184585 RepID=UPI002FD303EF